MEQFLNIMKNFKNQKVLVVGDLMLDEYLIGSVDRISPEAPIPILDVKEIKHVPGGAANTAFNVQSLEGQAMVAGVVGDDEKGVLLKNLLVEKGIDIRGVFADSSRRTTLKTRAVAKNQHIVRIDLEDRNPITPELEEKILQFIASQIKNLKAIIISDYSKGVVTPSFSKGVIDLARSNNVLSLVDGKADDFSKYKGCGIIAPNKKEFARALNLAPGELASEGRFLQAGKMLLAHVMSDNVLVKCGDQGMILFKRDGSSFRHRAINRNPIDVSGAGDTAMATIALALASGASSEQAVTLASHACGIGVSKMGTAVVLPNELEDSLRNN